ncbi:MAG: hypothetical protein IJ643_05160 [Eubacterium sp.]|nr:hypothetical protein [Eubacterium sp.]
MKKIIKIDGRPILNFMDLKCETLQPLQLYEQLYSFTVFSKTHCSKYPILFTDKTDKMMVAEYFTSEFWQSVIESNDWDSEGHNALNVLERLIEKKYKDIFFSENYANCIIKNWTLEFIQNKNKQPEKTTDSKKDADPLNNKNVKKAAVIAVNDEISKLLKNVFSGKGIKQIPSDMSDAQKASIYKKLDKAYKKVETTESSNLVKTNEANNIYDRILALKNEYECLQLKDKINFIIEKTDSKNNVHKTLSLLAICELSDCDARKAEWKEKQKLQITNNEAEPKTDNTDIKENKTSNIENNITHKDNKAKNEHSATMNKENIVVTVYENKPALFPYENSFSIDCSNEPVKYYCYDSDTLTQGDKIRTVKITAKRNGVFDVAHIQLFSEKQNKCVQKIRLRAGDNVYINVAGDRIIKVLPEIYFGSDLCVLRKNNNLKVYPKNKDAWITSMDNITSVAVGSSNDGFLIVSGGKIRTHFCEIIENNYTARLTVNSILSPVAEVAKDDVGFAILLADGTVIHSHSSKREKNVLSLGQRYIDERYFSGMTNHFYNIEIVHAADTARFKFSV